MRKIVRLNFNKHWPFFWILVLVAVFAFPFLAKGRVPFPADYLVDFFIPWQYYFSLPVKNAAMPDVISQMYPWKHLVIDFWKSGFVPFWNPFQFGGGPLLANYQSAVFHPANWLFFLLPQIDAWSLMILAQPFLAGWFTYLFASSLKISRAGSLLAAISFMFGGFITSWMAYGTMAWALLWLPLILYGLEKLFDDQKAKWGLVISLPLATSFFCGHFQISLYVLAFTGAYLVFKFWRSHGLKTFFLGLLFLALGLGISAPQILPSVELHGLSVRSYSFGISEIVPWRYLVTLFAPDFYGNPVTRNDWFGHWAEWNGFGGVIPLVLASFVIWSKKKKRHEWFFLTMAIATLFLILPTPALDLLTKLKIPVLSTSAASRIMSVFGFCLAVCAGFGLDRWLKMVKGKNLKAFTFFGSAWALIVGSLWFWVLVLRPFLADQNEIAKRNLVFPSLIFICFFFLSAAAMAWISLAGQKKSNLFLKRINVKPVIFLISFFFLAITSFDMWRLADKFVPFDHRQNVYPSLPVLEYLSRETPPYRVYGYYGMETQNWAQIHGFGGYDPLYLARYGELLKASEDGIIKPPSTRGVDLPRRGGRALRVVELMGGRYLLHALGDGRADWTFNFWDYPDRFDLLYADDKYEVYQNKEALPRAFVVYDYEVITEPRAIVDRLFSDDFDPSAKMILEKEIDFEGFPDEPAIEAPIASFTPNKIELTVKTEKPGLLFLAENHYPGWQVVVGGNPAEIYRADYTFRAVKVPAGEHEVEFIYRPESFRIGAISALFSLFFLVIITLTKGLNLTNL